MQVRSDKIYRVLQSPTSMYYAVLPQGRRKVETFESHKQATLHYGQLPLEIVNEWEFEVALTEEIGRRYSQSTVGLIYTGQCAEGVRGCISTHHAGPDGHIDSYMEPIPDEKLFLVCEGSEVECGEAFDSVVTADHHAHQANHGPDTTFTIKPESEAM